MRSLPTKRADPKSTRRTSDASVSSDFNNTFSGLRSRWAMPMEWRYATASTTSRMTDAAPFAVYAPRSTRRSKSSPPRASSVTMYQASAPSKISL